MDFKCNCSLTARCVGDGCSICNTELYIDMLPNPEECAQELEGEAHFTTDQASYIASEVYQPLLGLIATLSRKIDQLAKEGK